MTAKIQPCLWFNMNAEEAAHFYAATFPNSRIDAIHHAPGDYPAGKKGNVLTVEMTIFGMPFLLLNGGPQFSFDEAISFQVATEDQGETDRYWNAIVAGGGKESACGWCKDRFGLSWQITPKRLRNHRRRRRNGTAPSCNDGDGEDRHRRADRAVGSGKRGRSGCRNTS